MNYLFSIENVKWFTVKPDYYQIAKFEELTLRKIISEFYPFYRTTCKVTT